MRTVLLRHTLPDGSFHYDWLIEPPPPEEGLIAFRVAERIDAPTCSEFAAVRLPPHRRLYLDYEGDISGGRGDVRRVAQGGCEISDSGEMVKGTVDFGAGKRGFVGHRGVDDCWTFEFLT